MKDEKKYLGINQPIPYKVLEEVVYNLLMGERMSNEIIQNHLREYIKGDNRLKKALSHINTIIDNSEKIISKIKVYMNSEAYLKLSNDDRTAMLICLVALTYPVTHEILNVLGSGFKVQSKINKAFIDQKLMGIYGSNRGIYNAIGAVVPMLVEFGLLKRLRAGVYELEEQKEIQNKLLNELYVYTDIKLSDSKSILLDDLEYRPWYMYFKPKYTTKNSIGLLKLIESRVGRGYLTI